MAINWKEIEQNDWNHREKTIEYWIAKSSALSKELNQAVYLQDKVRSERDKAEAENARLRAELEGQKQARASEVAAEKIALERCDRYREALEKIAGPKKPGYAGFYQFKKIAREALGY